jgi:hypothetical protein
MLRHGTGYKLANDGQDTRAIQQYLGHRNIQNTTRYTDLAPDRFKDFWRDWSERLPGALGLMPQAAEGGSAQMPVGAVHACIAFQEAVAVIRLACNFSQQFFHRLVKVFVVAVGNRREWTEASGVCILGKATSFEPLAKHRGESGKCQGTT